MCTPHQPGNTSRLCPAPFTTGSPAAALPVSPGAPCSCNNRRSEQHLMPLLLLLLGLSMQAAVSCSCSCSSSRYHLAEPVADAASVAAWPATAAVLGGAHPCAALLHTAPCKHVRSQCEACVCSMLRQHRLVSAARAASTPCCVLPALP